MGVAKMGSNVWSAPEKGLCWWSDMLYYRHVTKTTMEDDRWNLTLERSKVRHGKFLGIQKSQMGRTWIERHYRERINAISWNRSGGYSWDITCRERTEARPNIMSVTEKSYPETYYVVIFQYAEQVREILVGPILWMDTKKPILIIQNKYTLLYK